MRLVDERLLSHFFCNEKLRLCETIIVKFTIFLQKKCLKVPYHLLQQGRLLVVLRGGNSNVQRQRE